MLAQFCFERKPKATPPISEKIKELRSLVRLQGSEIKKRTEEQNRLHAAANEYVREMIRENISFINNQIKSIEEKIMEVINRDYAAAWLKALLCKKCRIFYFENFSLPLTLPSPARGEGFSLFSKFTAA